MPIREIYTREKSVFKKIRESRNLIPLKGSQEKIQSFILNIVVYSTVKCRQNTETFHSNN